MLVHPKAHSYQKKALAFSLKHYEGSYQALDMGLGKTLIALMWMRNIKRTQATLVITPIKPMHITWPDEIDKWVPNTPYRILHGPNKALELRRPADIYLMNFQGIQWLEKELKKLWSTERRMPFRSIVVDEGSMLKSPKTKRFKALRRLRRIFVEGRLMLGATPAPNSLLDLWSQYFFLDEGKRLGKNYGLYQATYFVPQDQRGFRWFIKPGADTLIHKAISDITYRLDADDYIKLPKRINNYIKLDLPARLYKQYKKLEDEFFLELGDTQIEPFNEASLSMKLRQFVQGALYEARVPGVKTRPYIHLHDEKLEVLKGLVEQANGSPILCAIQFIFELDLIRKVFPDAPIIRGGVSGAEAAAIIRRWNAGEIPLLLCHPKSISHGMNMQLGPGHMVLWYAMTWSRDQYDQLIGRLKRQGQAKDHVIVHHILFKNTVDIAIAVSLRDKDKTQSKLLNYIKAYHRGEITDDMLN